MLAISFGSIGCQKSQPYVLGSAPNYLRPYSPGAPPAIAPTPGSSLPGNSTGPTAPAVALPSPPAGSASDASNFAYAAQISELERRARLLDENNRQLHSQLAQAQQQVQTYRERSDLMQQQLADMSSQLQQSRLAASRSVQPNLPPSSVAANPQGAISAPGSLANSGIAPPSNPILPPSLKSIDSSRRSGARLTANTSRSSDPVGGSAIAPLQALGYPVETNGTALRVRIPADQLFQPGTSQWTPSAGALLERVSGALRTASPNGQLLIDTYTDNSSQSINGVGSPEQLTLQQSEAIQSYLVSRGGWTPGTVTKRSNGADMPIMDNQTPSGRAANRRIEFIISQDR